MQSHGVLGKETETLRLASKLSIENQWSDESTDKLTFIS